MVVGDDQQEAAAGTDVDRQGLGFGRLVRSHADRGVAAILDPRLYTRAYGPELLDALPPSPLVDDREEVAAFFGEEARNESVSTGVAGA